MAYTGDRVCSTSGTIYVITPSTTSRVALSASSVRTGLLFQNDSSAAVYIAYNLVASTGSYTLKLADQNNHNDDRSRPWTGPVSIVWNTVVTTGSLFITELV